MPPRILSIGVATVLLAFAGCQKKAEAPPPPPAPKPLAVEVVKESERSRSFVAVNQHLELGGTLYGYVDVDGDVLKVMGGLHDLVTQFVAVQPMLAPVAQQDFGALATTLGLTDIKAIGFSSVRDESGFFRNRAFLYTPGDRHGLMLGLGGKPGPLAHVNLAPADAAFYGEAEVDLPVVYRTIKEVVAKVAGEPVGNLMESKLKQAGENVALSALNVIYGLKGRSALVVRVDPKKTIQLPGRPGTVLPSFSLLLCVDSVAPAIEPALQKSPLFKRSDEGALHVYEFAQPLPIEGLKPLIVIDGSTLFFATNRAFLDECRSTKPGLAADPEFKAALAAVGAENNGVTYIHPRLFEAIRSIGKLNPGLPAQAQTMLKMAAAKMPNANRPLIAIRTNLPDGILIRGYWDRSMKQDLAMAAMYNPVSVGFLAAMAIPAFQKVRASSQEKAVLNNLRQLASAADQFYLEHGAVSVTYDELVGPEPNKYIREIHSVAGEDYRHLTFKQGEPLVVRLPDGRQVRFDP